MRPTPAFQLAIASAAVTNGATATALPIDTAPAGNKGKAKHLIISVSSTTVDNATNIPSVFKLQHSNTTDATNFADITGAVMGSHSGDTTNPNKYLLSLDLIGTRRYIRVLISPRTTVTLTAHALLYGLPEQVGASKSQVLALFEGQ